MQNDVQYTKNIPESAVFSKRLIFYNQIYLIIEFVLLIL